MRTTVTLDDKLVADAQFYTGIRAGPGSPEPTDLTPDAKLWTCDRRLQNIANELRVAAMLPH